ncbi:MAG: cupin domain-containing protein [Gammaproteobacteria bacterium]|nr:MAG: cupin domain-containing protein [Gammaproteobacteria bacterium]
MNEKTRVIDWDSLEREHVRPGVSRAAFRGENVLLVMNWLQPGMEVRPHSHPFEQVVYIVQGKMRFQIGDETVEIGAGGVLRIPPNVQHCGEPISDEPVMNLDVFSPIRDDYRHLVAYQLADFEDL